MRDYVIDATNRLLKGIDREESEEDDDDFNPGNTPDNLDQHPHDEEEWQEDYNAEYDEKECTHTDQRGRELDEEDCPHCNPDEV